jgi:UDPglucose 6-dehydrogenase
LAARGVQTIGVDIDQEKIDILTKGKTTFYEPDLDEKLRTVLADKHLTLTQDYREAVRKSQITFVTVGTPGNADGSINLDQVKAASASIGEILREDSDYHLVVIRSTVTPGTAENTVKPMLESCSAKTSGRDFGLCTNPEFLSEGSAVHVMLNPDRIIVGEFDKEAGDTLVRFYNDFYGERMPPLLRTTPVNAELIKYANNAFLATKISFINSIANLCERIPGTDVEVVAKGIGLDPRIGPLFLRAGLGWGGSCLPKDLRAIQTYASRLGKDLPIVRASVEVNEAQPFRAVELAKRLIGVLKGNTIAVLGLSFKPDTDDIRESVAIKIVKRFLEEGAHVAVHDPNALQNARKILGEEAHYFENVKECIRGADCCVIATEWKEFENITADNFVKAMRTPCVVDGRRIYRPGNFKPMMKYAAIGLA